MTIPKKKNDDALILLRWKKKKIVFFIPIIKARPERNNNYDVQSFIS